MIKLRPMLSEITRDRYYYIQHLLDLDPNAEAEKLMDDLEKSVYKWVQIYDPQLNGNQFEWHPSSTLHMGEYAIKLTPNIFRQTQQFIIFSIEITITKSSFLGDKKPKVINHFEEPMNISSPDGRNWDFSALISKIANLIRATKDLLKKDYG